MREAFANEALWKEFQTGIWDTIYSTVAATLVACVLGIILGIILVAGEEDGVRPLPGPVMKVLNFAINILRSVPFLILMIMVLPLSELLVGTTIGTVASIPPLIIASASFVARLVETSLREVDKGVIEAAQSMGCSPFQIIWKVILPESLPSLVASFTTAFITILGYGAMAGAIGGGGLGKIAINYGYYKYNYAVMLIAVVFIVVLVHIYSGRSRKDDRTGTERAVKDHRRTAVLRDYFIGHRQRGRISSHHSVPLYHAEAEATI